MDRRNVLAALCGAAMVMPDIARADDVRTPAQLGEAFAASLSSHDMDAFAALFADDYVNHQASAAAPPPAGAPHKQLTVDFFTARLHGLPDLKVSIERMVATDDQIAASFVYEGTQQGTLLGVPATGRPMRFTSCDIFRVANGKFAEHWGMGDIAGQLAEMKG